MITKVRKIGNSYGILLNKKLLEQAKMKDEVKLSFVEDKIIIEPIKENPRKDWEKQLLEANSLKEDEKIYPDFNNQFDDEEWTW